LSRARIGAVIIIGIIIIAVFVPLLIGLLNPYAIVHGYDGPVATVHSVEQDYRGGDPSLFPNLIVYEGTTSAWVDPNTADVLDAVVPCGVKVTFQGAPVVYASEIIDNVTEVVVDDVTKTNKTKTWVVQEVELRMGATVETYKGGIQDSPGATFWVQLTENEFSVFSGVTDSIGYFIEIVSHERSDKTGSIEVLGEDQGYNYEIVPLEEVEVPQFIIDGGYTESAKYFNKVRFPIELVRAAPTTIIGAAREESRLDLHISIMVLLFGYWERTVKYIEWLGAEDPTGWAWLDDLLAGITKFLWLIVGVIGTIIVVMKVKNPRYVAVTLAILWSITLWQMGALDALLGAVGV